MAFAAYVFITGPLLENPHRVGKRLRPPLDDRFTARRGTYRVVYRIQEPERKVTVVGVFSRADAYRARCGDIAPFPSAFELLGPLPEDDLTETF